MPSRRKTARPDSFGAGECSCLMWRLCVNSMMRNERRILVITCFVFSARGLPGELRARPGSQSRRHPM